jgi:hypothetical protein
MEPGWLAFRTDCWQKMRQKMRRLWSELVEGAVLGLEWILAILDFCLQIFCVAYMLFYQVLVQHFNRIVTTHHLSNEFLFATGERERENFFTVLVYPVLGLLKRPEKLSGLYFWFYISNSSQIVLKNTIFNTIQNKNLKI